MTDEFSVAASGIAPISGIAQLEIPSQRWISIVAFNQASDNSLANLQQNRNVPIQSEEIVPNDGSVHSGHSPKLETSLQRYLSQNMGKECTYMVALWWAQIF